MSECVCECVCVCECECVRECKWNVSASFYRGSGVGFIEFIKIKIQSHHMTYNVYVGWFLISCTQ